MNDTLCEGHFDKQHSGELAVFLYSRLFTRSEFHTDRFVIAAILPVPKTLCVSDILRTVGNAQSNIHGMSEPLLQTFMVSC